MNYEQLVEELQESKHPLPSSSKNFVKHFVQIEADEQRAQSVILSEAVHLTHLLLPLVESDQILGPLILTY